MEEIPIFDFQQRDSYNTDLHNVNKVQYNNFCYPFSVTEKGDFLALDLGGSKFRILKVKVSENGKQHVQMESQFYPTPKEIIQGNGTDVSSA